MLAPRGGLLCPWPELLGSHGIPLKLRVFITVYFHLLVLNRTAGKKLPRSSHHHASGHKPGAQCRADDWTGWTLRTLTSSGFLLQTCPAVRTPAHTRWSETQPRPSLTLLSGAVSLFLPPQSPVHTLRVRKKLSGDGSSLRDLLNFDFNITDGEL